MGSAPGKEKQQHFITKNYDNWENYIRGIPGTIRPLMRGMLTSNMKDNIIYTFPR